MKQTILSVIIPCYNTPRHFIEAAVKSAYQAGDGCEILLIDDGSNAACHTMLEEIAAHYDNLELITTSNGGVSKARNLGVNRAKGRYVTFLDADDLLSSELYKDVCKIVSEYEPELLIAGARDFSNDDEVTSEEHVGESVGIDKCDKAKRQRLIQYYLDYNTASYELRGKSSIGRGEISGRVIRRDVMLENLFDTSIRYGEDLLWNIGLLQTCDEVYIVDSHWYWYRYNQNSVSRSYNPEIYKDMIKLLSRIESMIDIDNNDMYLAFVDKIYNCIYISWKYYIGNKQTSRADRKKIKRSIMREYPWVKIKDKRYRSLCNKKMRLFSSLYKLNLLFTALQVRDIVGI